jgi:hypothetical protein
MTKSRLLVSALALLCSLGVGAEPTRFSTDSMRPGMSLENTLFLNESSPKQGSYQFVHRLLKTENEADTYVLLKGRDVLASSGRNLELDGKRILSSSDSWSVVCNILGQPDMILPLVRKQFGEKHQKTLHFRDGLVIETLFAKAKGSNDLRALRFRLYPYSIETNPLP